VAEKCKQQRRDNWKQVDILDRVEPRSYRNLSIAVRRFQGKHSSEFDVIERILKSEAQKNKVEFATAGSGKSSKVTNNQIPPIKRERL
jgi:hypothetical protein